MGTKSKTAVTANADDILWMIRIGSNLLAFSARNRGRGSEKGKGRREGKERQKQKHNEARWAREEKEQNSDLERERREALARVRLTLEAPPGTSAATSSQGERTSRSPPPEESVDESDSG
ncbi:hypothetical protein N431DRAFT_442351 [Stipitochalara longipes BDJ]|nr:hypothetical protein N431DRAFT_442351 [Stipitochalara longipes BDJ]